MKNLKKINSRGEYTDFPGVTVISKVDAHQRDLWRRVYDCMSQSALVKEYYSPLPSDSYHMTAVNLYTEAMDPADQDMSWETFLTHKLPLLGQLNTLCINHSFIPDIKRVSMDVSSSIRIVIELSDEHQRVIQDFAEQFGLSDFLPDVFHITLAYQYKRISPDIKLAIARQLEQTILNVFQSSAQLPMLQSPQLCYFNSMLAFEPWDGLSYPFASDSSALYRPSFL